jgi:hypothetical protein
VRETVNLRTSDSDQDDFLRNRVTFLAEGRWALAVTEPSAFVLVHLAAGTRGSAPSAAPTRRTAPRAE